MIPWQYRLYFWGVHGVFAEVVFTGIWEFIVSGNWRLMGTSSIWSFFVYGLGTILLAEISHNFLVPYKVHLLLRCLVYVMATYLWEFSWGMFLDLFNARPWDYSNFRYNVKGLITMEYAPLWFLAGLYFEVIISVMKTMEPVPRWSQKID